MATLVLFILFLFCISVIQLGFAKSIFGFLVGAPLGCIIGFGAVLLMTTLHETFSNYVYSFDILFYMFGGIGLGAIIGFFVSISLLGSDGQFDSYAARLHRDKIKRWKKVTNTQSGASILHNYLHLTEEEN